jgi:hypothetical protein
MAQPDAIMTRMVEGLALSQQGQRTAARTLWEALWASVGERGDPLHRCALAHHLADVQDDPAAELSWDLRALEAADALSGERAAEAGVTAVARLYPSLHLNLGDVYLRLGDVDAARQHLAAGTIAVAALADDGYGTMIQRGLQGLRERLNAR